jgi:hypothetical protein
MQYYTPSIPAIECPPLVPDNTPTLVCFVTIPQHLSFFDYGERIEIVFLE